MDDPFFTGVIRGVGNYRVTMYNGAIRTAGNLGLHGKAAQSQITWENEMSLAAARWGMRSVTASGPPTLGSWMSTLAWQTLPTTFTGWVRDEMLETAGEAVGGTLVSTYLGAALISKFGAHGLFIAPALLVCSSQGMMAALWKWRH